ncbi:hypothetical protein ACAG39_10800 [Caldicellulosiruptoraceae bacterium PP1]
MEEDLYDLDILAIIKTNNGREFDIIKGDNQFKQSILRFSNISELMEETEKYKFFELLNKRVEMDKFFYSNTKLTIDGYTYYGLIISTNDNKNLYLLLLNCNVTKEPIYFKSLSKLNNELMITQKELYKKNIELQKLNKKLNEMLITEELTVLYI